MQKILRRVFVTNWKTTLGSAVIILGMCLWAVGKVTTEQLVLLMGVAGAWIGGFAKDGVRDETVVAREDTAQTPPSEEPTI